MVCCCAVYQMLAFFNCLFIWLCQILVAPCEIFVACGIFSCGMRDLVSRPGIEPGSPAFGAQSLSHWTIREVPQILSYTSFNIRDKQ